MKEIYLDHAATTYTDPEVLEAMLPYFQEIYGNAESMHTQGQKSSTAIRKARQTVAQILNCQPKEVIFTGTATEANNLAIFGVTKAKLKENNSQKLRIITTKIEHPSVYYPCKKLEEEGCEVIFLDVDSQGFINLENLESLISKDPNSIAIVSIIYGQNEIGTVQEISKISKICKKYEVIFHTDACQAGGSLELDCQKLEVDLMTLNGSKIYGPKGVGMLFCSSKVPIEPVMFGGNHEFGIRPGTHNTPNIIGFAKALELAQEKKEKENQRLSELRDFAIDFLDSEIPDTKINGDRKKRLPNNINISIKGVNAQEILLKLNEKSIYISTGSACKVKSGDASGVLAALGVEKSLALGTVRLTIGQKTTKEDLEFALRKIKEVVRSLRESRFQRA